MDTSTSRWTAVDGLVDTALKVGRGTAPDCPGTGEPRPTAGLPDDDAVDRFAALLKAKLARKRDQGRGGWETCPPQMLSEMLHEHVVKGDPVDVAIFSMMLSALGSPILPSADMMPDRVADRASG